MLYIRAVDGSTWKLLGDLTAGNAMRSGLMNIGQAADYLQVSRETLYKYVQKAKVPAIKIGRHWRFSRSELGAWVHDSYARDRAPAPRRKPDAAVPLRVLVVDDDAAIRSLLAAWLKQSGQDVASASTGAEAIRMLEHGQYDLLMLDLYLSDMTGAEVLNRTRGQDGPEVVLITGAPDSQAMEQALGHPVAYALTKPFGRADVEGVVRMVHSARVDRRSGG